MMNKTSAEAADLAREMVLAVAQRPDVDVVVCPPFTAIESVARVVEGSLVKLGAQNMHHEPNGAFTCEVFRADAARRFLPRRSFSAIVSAARISAKPTRSSTKRCWPR